MTAGLLGQMVTPNSGNQLIPDVTWALDNGCFSAQWDEARWEATLARYAGHPHCLFAVVPDVVADAAATDRHWHRYAPIVKAHGYRAAYVMQNGCTRIPSDADVVFIGGDTTYKLAASTQKMAMASGLPVHMGRVNTRRRLQFAAAHHYDTVDGTLLAYGPDINLPRLLRDLRHADHPTLFTERP
jgi:hypothetical protein